MKLLPKKPILEQRGFTLPIVLIFVLIFLAAPIIFWITNLKTDVKGVETKSTEQGTYVQVVSEFGSWDLYEYLCKTLDECREGLATGKKWEAISGGTTSGSSVKINYSDLWTDYNYLKVFVRPGWGSASAHNFNLKDPKIVGSEVKVVDNTSMFILPISFVKSGSHTFLVFTDKF